MLSRLLSISLLMWTVGCASNRVAAAPATSIPLPLASALMNGQYGQGSAVQFTVGALPPGYPAAVVPDGPAHIVGGMTTNAQTVAVFSDSTRRLAAVMEELFERHGYTRPQPTPGSGFSPGTGPFGSFCGDSGTFAVEQLTGAARTLARVTFRRMSHDLCQAGFPAAQRIATLILPELKPPVGADVRGSHGGSPDGGVESEAQMTGTNLDAAAILAHYATQLAAAGWTTEPAAVSQHVAAQYVAAKDSAGSNWEGVLMTTGTPTALSVSLTMHRLRAR